ncbi:hypothetical protein N7474_007996 [Penicillium riverlandense]|uniref:uncharacterized protein n=1 Tax=Penicillium riverlandense TaxID=1903569 RepID=UPI002547AC94|nr:uncharacterized protein N7474_007996 [Penicillium riverlandense]KAJ5811695.1 hypothetical protein N7474_007996 [Penicillium riverlandense]
MYLTKVTGRFRILMVSALLLFTFWHLSSWRVEPYAFSIGSLHHAPTYNLSGHTEFWRQFQPLLEEHEPKCGPPRRIGNAEIARYKTSDPDPRPDMLEMPAHDVLRMTKAHSDFVDAINANPPSLSYVPGSRGLVCTAGGQYLPILVISLRMLRRTGSRLPVEVFLANHDEYEEHICEKVLPSLNAKCVILSDVLDASSGSRPIEKFQFKPFAMLFSSFEDILFLDADAFPLAKPESLFKHEPFQSKGMLTWPDFWASSVSPLYYRISSQEVAAMDLRQSTESGEVLISKRTHFKTLLLSTYYNYWGPTHYYRLFSQGTAGEGDKETFLAAATALGEPFYQVSERICAIGHRTEGGLAGSAMVQFSPIEDYKLTQKGIWRVSGDNSAKQPRPFFIHANFPKFNPATVFSQQSVNPAFNDDGSYTRAWTMPDFVVNDFGRDVEKEFWAEIMWTACELEDKFKSWENQTTICPDVKKYWTAVFGEEDPRGV